MTKPKAYYQAYLVIKCLSKEEYSLIPKDLLNEITSKMEKDPSIVVDSTVPLEKQKIDEKTYDILERVIKAIEKAYGADAIDNPQKYATDVNKSKKEEVPVEIDIDVKDIKPIDTKKGIKNEPKKESRKDQEEVGKLKEENIKLHSIITALEEESKKMDEARELYYNYKDIVAKKDEKIRALSDEVEQLKKSNEELYQSIEKVPKIIKKIFIKNPTTMLNSGEVHKIE